MITTSAAETTTDEDETSRYGNERRPLTGISTISPDTRAARPQLITSLDKFMQYKSNHEQNLPYNDPLPPDRNPSGDTTL